MNYILDIKVTLMFLGIIAIDSINSDHVYKFFSFIIFAGYNIHRWVKFHQETKKKK